MSIPLSLFLYIYYAGIAVAVLYALFTLLTAFRHSDLDGRIFLATICFIVAFGFSILTSVALLSRQDLSDKINLFVPSNSEILQPF